MKKNIFSVLILVVASLLLFASCAKKKSELIRKEWLVKSAKYGPIELKENDISVKFTFREDSTFSRLEQGKTEDGKWALSADENKLILSFAETGDKVEYVITELNEEKLVIKGQEMSMDREYTMTPVPKADK